MQRLSHGEEGNSIDQEHVFEVDDRFKFYMVTRGSNVSVTE